MPADLDKLRVELVMIRKELGWAEDPNEPAPLRRSDQPHQTSPDFNSPETVAARLRQRKKRDNLIKRMHDLEALIEAMAPLPETLRDKVWDQIESDFIMDRGRLPTREERIVETQGYIAQFMDMVAHGLL